MECAYTKWYYPNQIEFILNTYGKNVTYTDFKKAPQPKAGEPSKIKKPVISYRYMNTAVSFDTESSSFIYNDNKYSTMYAWGMDIFGCTIIGRTWAEWLYVLNYIQKFYKLSLTNRMIIYVHNLSYDFALFHRWIEWNEVFAIRSRSVLFAVSADGIEFRCSYKMSGKSLKVLAKDMNGDLQKLDENFDYSLLRHSETHLTNDEIEYLVHDVKIVTTYINRELQNCSIDKLPFTITGVVRRYCRDHCIGTSAGEEVSRCYRKHIHQMTLTRDEYFQAHSAFQGGFTHSNPCRTETVYDNVASYDITSSYPTVMVSEKFPMGKGVLTDFMDKETFLKNVSRDDIIMTCNLVLKNVRPKFKNDFYISLSKCYDVENELCSNGRVVYADTLKLTCTSVDYTIIEKCYDFDIDLVFNIYTYKAGYLPKQIVEAILYFYAGKTEKKDVDGEEAIYMLLKAMLNSVYGMSVEDIIRDFYTYNYDEKDWNEPTHKEDMDDELLNILINNANNDKNRFLFYLWGVFITAYARKNIWSAILECGDDYIYCDTDSVKFVNYEKHRQFFDMYNADIQTKIQKCLGHYKINPESARPKNKKGEVKPLGVFDFEGVYSKFKTLGAKRYLYMDECGFFHLTCAGVNKSTGVEYLLQSNVMMTKEQYVDMVFNRFYIGMAIPAEFTGKQTLSYIKSEYDMDVTDYEGFTYHIHELSGVHMENASFDTDKKGGRSFQHFIQEYKKEREWI